MKFLAFLILTFFFSAKIQAAELPDSMTDLKIAFIGKIQYKFVEKPEEDIKTSSVSILVDTFYQSLIDTNFKRLSEFEIQYLSFTDHYAEASYIWYKKLQEEGGFIYANLREFWWCLLSTNSYAELTLFTKKMMDKVEKLTLSS